jgi:hypothetical protein
MRRHGGQHLHRGTGGTCRGSCPNRCPGRSKRRPLACSIGTLRRVDCLSLSLSRSPRSHSQALYPFLSLSLLDCAHSVALAQHSVVTVQAASAWDRPPRSHSKNHSFCQQVDQSSGCGPKPSVSWVHLGQLLGSRRWPNGGASCGRRAVRWRRTEGTEQLRAATGGPGGGHVLPGFSSHRVARGRAAGGPCVC